MYFNVFDVKNNLWDRWGFWRVTVETVGESFWRVSVERKKLLATDSLYHRLFFSCTSLRY